MNQRILAASAIVALAVSTSAFAQGNGKKAKPPSRNDLSSQSAATGAGAASPLAWVDDATVLDPGGVAVSISTIRWWGSGLSEVNIPIVDFALGVTKRVQLSASVPRVVDSSQPDGAVGGLGTTYFSAKIGVAENRTHTAKLAVLPTIEVLSPGVVAGLAPGEHRVQLGLPVSGELDRGRLRLYGATGYFTRGAWFTGAGAGLSVNDKVSVSTGFSRAWRKSVVPDVPLSDRDRNEISGSASYGFTPTVRVFASLSRTVATLPENGAGTTIGCGVSLFFTTPAK
jgi:hypothetical protein